jgi:DNA-binding NarL/FixJ family response regulator
MHKPYFTCKISQTLLGAYPAKKETSSKTTLTSRERSVVQLIAEGHTNKEIAGVLNISPKTVEAHRAAILRKLNLSSAAALVRYAVRHRLVE